MRDDRTLFLFVFRDDASDDDNPPATDEERKAALRRVFGDVGWECPQILAELEDGGGIYFDRVSQIRAKSWTEGRTALVGDAAACVSLLAGEGTGLAMAEAYVLAGELTRAKGDYRSAFVHYQERMMPFLLGKQKSASRFVSSFVPGTTFGIALRNVATWFLEFPFTSEVLMGRQMRDDVEIPNYAPL